MTSNRILAFTTALLALALTFSILLNFFLFKQGRQYYLQLNLTRLEPLGLGVYPPQTVERTTSEKLRDALNKQLVNILGELANQK
jgi:hypothetical protein